MAKKVIECLLIIDSREQDTYYLKDVLDKDDTIGSDKIIIKNSIVECVKPLDCKVSTGDIGLKWRYQGEIEWNDTKLAIELKKGLDMATSIMVKDNFNRLCKEVERARESDLDFYFLHTHNFTEIEKELKRLKKFKDSNIEVIYFESLLKFDKILRENGYSTICTGKENLGLAIRRIVKNYIKQYVK